MNYISHLLIYFSIYLLLSAGLNIVVGYCGLLTLAHAAYFAIGSYAYALGTTAWGWGAMPSLIFAMLVSAGLSPMVSLPTWRLRGDFFVMASVAVQTLVLSTLSNWSSPGSPPGTWQNLTNGPAGIAQIPNPETLGIRFDTVGRFAVFSMVLVCIFLVLIWSFLRSPWGRVLQSMRDDELATRGLGKPIRLLKLQAFAIACGSAGIAGALYAAYVRFVDPSLASVDQSILILSMVVVGGLGNFRGPLVGAAVLLAIPELLRFIHVPQSAIGEVRLVAYGLLLVLLVHVRPQGISGRYRLQ